MVHINIFMSCDPDSLGHKAKASVMFAMGKRSRKPRLASPGLCVYWINRKAASWSSRCHLHAGRAVFWITGCAKALTRCSPLESWHKEQWWHPSQSDFTVRLLCQILQNILAIKWLSLSPLYFSSVSQFVWNVTTLVPNKGEVDNRLIPANRIMFCVPECVCVCRCVWLPRKTIMLCLVSSLPLTVAHWPRLM